MITDRAVTLEGFSKGWDNLTPETSMPTASLREATNVDITNDGNVLRRPGYVSVYSGSNIHSLWSSQAVNYALFMDNGVLKKVDGQLSVSNLAIFSSKSALVSYCEYNGDIYFSNGIQTGRLHNGVVGYWGIPTPPSPIVAPASGGSLRAGTYQATYTYVNVDNEESGAPLASLVTVQEGGAIQFVGIPSLSSGYVRIFVTSANDQVLRQLVQLPAGTTSFTATDISERGRELMTQFMAPMPPGQIVRGHKGRLYVASRNVLYYSEALRPGLCSQRKNFFMFPDDITLVEPVEDGIYVATNRQTFFLAGLDPHTEDGMRQLLVDQVGAIPGTGTAIPPWLFGRDGEGKHAFWWDTNSVAVVGRNSGKIHRLTKNTLALPSYQSGTASYVARNGFEQVLSVLRGQGEANLAAVTDSAVATVTRNGITL